MRIAMTRLIYLLTFLTGLFASGTLHADTLRIGALLSLTGNWSTLGQASQVMMAMAEEDINRYLAGHGARYRIQVVVRDTRLQPAIAMEQYRQLVRQGAVTMVGPQSSSEVAALEPLVARHRIPLISQGSTAFTLAKPGDRIYRIVPDDTHEADALADLLKRRGVTRLVPLWRDDAGNNGLHDSLQTRFAAHGGVMSAGVHYRADQQDFSSVAAEASRQLQEAWQPPGGSSATAAIYVAGFDEAAALIRAAVDYPLLKTVKWYGSDGIARSAALLNDPIAAPYAAAVDFLNPNLGLPPAAQAKWQPLSDRYFAKTGERPDAFAMAAYDAAWVAALNASYRKSAPRLSRHDILGETAGQFFGATGWTALNAAGDRTREDYEFWAIRPDSTGQLGWSVVCRFDSAAGETTGAGCGL